MNKQIELFTQDQVSEMIQISPRTLERMRISGGGPTFIKLGRRVVYAPDDLKKWIKKNTFTSTSEYVDAFYA